MRPVLRQAAEHARTLEPYYRAMYLCAATSDVGMRRWMSDPWKRRSTMLPTHGRYGYAPITERPFYRWPNGAGLAVYLALNVEHYAFGEGLAEDLVPGMEQPDVLNSSWREYGTRVGAWRLLDLFREFDMPATILLNSAVCDHAPQLVRAMVDAGHEIAAHGRTNSESQAGLSEDDERALIDLVTDGIAKAAGSRPTGWLSPWLAETDLTPDLLQEAGYAYMLDWCADDQPIWLMARGGRILSLALCTGDQRQCRDYGPFRRRRRIRRYDHRSGR